MSGRLLSDKVRIILVHGMASKPDESRLLNLWSEALVGSLELDAGRFAARIRDDEALIESAYWADAVPDHLPDLPGAVQGMRGSLEKALAVRRKYGDAMHIDEDGWTSERVRRFGADVIEALSMSLSVRAEAFSEHLWELQRYHVDSGVADRIRRPLEDALRACWDAGRSAIVLAHSLGAAVAYDVLWRFAHRGEAEFRRYRRHTVELLISMGAPLADPTIQDVMLSGRWLRERKAANVARRRRAWLTNVRRWDNYSAIGDYVCHDLDMEKEFFVGMRKDLGTRHGRRELRDFRGLFNPYREPDGSPNPHKVFGYLIQPMLASRLCRLLKKLDG
jgi:hypothetical protein